MNWDVMYLSARQWGIQPSEFWGMTLNEWFCEWELNADSHSPENYAGKLTQGDVDDLMDDNELTDEEWWEKHGNSNSNQG